MRPRHHAGRCPRLLPHIAVEAEAASLWNVIETFYKGLRFYGLYRPPFMHDPDNMDAYAGGQDKWESTVEQLRSIESKVGKDYLTGVGEAAFYGPKNRFWRQRCPGADSIN